MERIIIPYTTEEAWLKERTKWLTSSDVPVLFGCGYQSYESLVEHKRNGTSPEFEETEEIQWGKAFEPAIAKEHARRNNWSIRRKDEFIVIPELRLGSSFDYSILDDHYEDTALMETKNVNQFKYNKDWLTKGFEIEATPYIEIQAQNEMLVSGIDELYIAVCVGGFKGVLLHREPNKKIQDAILQKAEKFWREVNGKG